MKKIPSVYSYLKSMGREWDAGSLFHFFNNGDENRDSKKVKEKIGAFLLDKLPFGSAKKIKERIQKGEHIGEICNAAHSKELFDYSKKRISENELNELGYSTNNLNTSSSLVEKSFFFQKMDEWDSIETNLESHKKKGKLLEVYLVKKNINFVELKPDEHKMPVNYNEQKYFNVFRSAVGNLMVAFSLEDRAIIEKALDMIALHSDDWNKHCNIDNFSGKLVSGVPLENGEVQKIEKVMQMSYEELPYWRETLHHPYYFLNKKKLEKNKNYYITKDFTFSEDNQDSIATVNGYGAISHYLAFNFNEK
jgi:hypothetical protein